MDCSDLLQLHASPTTRIGGLSYNLVKSSTELNIFSTTMLSPSCVTLSCETNLVEALAMTSPLFPSHKPARADRHPSSSFYSCAAPPLPPVDFLPAISVFHTHWPPPQHRHLPRYRQPPHRRPMLCSWRTPQPTEADHHIRNGVEVPRKLEHGAEPSTFLDISE